MDDFGISHEEWKLSIQDYTDELIRFFKDFFPTLESTEAFVNGVHDIRTDKTPMRMLHQIERLIQLADDIEKIRPGHDVLKVSYLNCNLVYQCAK